ncbi:MAG: KdsC family phosphatase [Kordiimonas sp.]
MPIKLFVLDVDGVMTDGCIHYTAEGEEVKVFHAHDGLGLKLLHTLGVELAVISGRESAPLSRRLDDLGIQRRRLKCADKISALQEMCDELDISLSEVAFMGDDLIDLTAMQASGYALAPINAVDTVKDNADWISTKVGGHGAVREACEHLAKQMGKSLEEAAAYVKKVLVQ